MSGADKSLLLQTVRAINDLLPKRDEAAHVVQEFLRSYPLTTIPKEELDGMELNLNNGKPEVDCLCDISTHFRFKKDKLREFLGFETGIVRDNALAFLPFLFANSISFLFNLPGAEMNNDLELMIRCLHYVSAPLDAPYLELIDNLVMLIVRRTVPVAPTSFHDELVSVFCSHVNYFHFDDPNVVPVLSEILNMSFSNGNQESATTVLTTLKDVIGSCNCFAQIKLYLLPVLEVWIHSLDRLVFDIIGMLGGMKASEHLVRLYCGIPDAIYHFVEEHREIFQDFHVQESAEPLPYDDYSKNQIDDQAEPRNDQPVETVIDASLDLSTFRIEEFYPEGMMPMVDIVMLAFVHAKNVFLNRFLEAFAALLQRHQDNDLLLVFVYFLSKIKGIKRVDVWAVETLVNPFFFCPSLTIFNAKLTPRTNFFRATIIGIICFYGHTLVPMLLDKFVSFPYLFPEILMRVANCFPGFVDIKVMFSQGVFEDLMRCERTLQLISGHVPMDIKAIAASARLKIFKFAFALFELKDVPPNVYESPFFRSSFLWAFCEPGLNALMFAQLQKILTKETTSEQTVHFLISSVKCNVMAGKDELAVNLLRCLGECLNLNKTLIEGAPELFKTSLEHAKSMTVFQSVLRFGVQLSHHCQEYALDFSDMSRIAKFMNAREDLDENCISYLVCLLSQSSLHRFGSAFLVSQPAIVIVLMSVFSTHGKIRECLDYIRKLLDFSLYNAVALHHGEFDMLLLDMITHCPGDFYFRRCKIVVNDESMFGEMFLLFNMIVSHCSSPIIANRFLSVVMPRRETGVDCFISDRGIPDVAAFKVRNTKLTPFIAGLTSKLASVQATRSIALSFACRCVVCDKQISFADFTSGFTLCFSILMDGQLASVLQRKVVVFDIKDSVGLIAEVFLQGSSLLMSVSSNESLVTFILVDEFPTSKQTTVILEMMNNGDKKLKARSYVVGKYPQSGDVRLLDLEPSSMLTMCFGQEVPELPEFEQEKMAIAFKMSDAFVANRVLTVSERREVLTSIDSFQNVFCRLPVESKVSPVKNLGDVLRQEFPAEYVVPMFLFLDTYKPSEQEILVDFITLNSGPRLARYFFVISKLLRENKPEVLRFGIYQKLTGLIDVCRTSEDYFDLYDSILCNISLWKHLPQLERIIAHWTQTLYMLCPKYFMEPTFFDKIMHVMREIPESGPAIDAVMSLLNKRISETFSLDECRGILISLVRGCGNVKLLDIVSTMDLEFDEEMAQLVSNISYSGRTEDIIHIVKFLKRCKNWTNFYPIFVYRLRDNVDEVLLEKHSTEIPELVFCVLWVQLIKQQKMKADILQKFSNLLPKNSFMFIIMLILASNMDPASMADIGVSLSCYLDQLNDIDMFRTILDMIDVFGSSDMACLLCKLYYDRLVLSPQGDNISEMLIGCYRALFVKRRPYIHQRELLNDEVAYDPNELSSTQDLANIVSHEYVYSVCPKEKCHFSRYEKSLLEFSSCLLAGHNVSTNPLLNYIVQHFDYKPENRGQFFDANLIDQILTPIREHSKLTMEMLNQFFKSISSPAVPEPTIQQREQANRHNSMSQMANLHWRRILKDFMHQETIWGLTDYTWVRDHHISDNFTSNRLKRTVLYRVNPEPQQAIDTKHSICQFDCVCIKVTSGQKGTLFGYQTCMILALENKTKTIEHSQIAHMLLRMKNAHATCIEFFLTNGYSILLDFAPVNARKVMQALKIPKPKGSIFQIKESFQELITNTKIVDEYNQRKISTVTFLSWLNMLSGRSYHDISNYPIFPYLGFETPRDLSLPACCVNDRARTRLQTRLRDTGSTFSAFPSNMIVLGYFLVRQEPFTSIHLSMNDHKFDDLDRQFLSTKAFAKSVTVGDQNIESCPEFFTMPEAFITLNRNSSSIPTLDVTERYCDPYEFAYHLLILLEESDLSKWLDLMFGVGLNNPERLNVFDPATVPAAEEDANDHVRAGQMGTLTPRVFASPVSQRMERIPFDPVIMPQPLNETVKEAFVLGTTLYFVNRNGNLMALKSDKAEDQKIEASRCLCWNENEALLLKTDGHRVLINKDGKSKEATGGISLDVFVLTEPSLLVSANRNGWIQFQNALDLAEVYPPLLVLSDIVTCLHVSKSFGVLVYGTVDGVIGIISMRQRRFVNSYNIGVMPDKILVTSNVGYIIVAAQREITLLTINGFHIKTVSLDNRIDKICQVQMEGIDYVAVTDTLGHVFIFEAFYPEKIRSLGSCGNDPLVFLGPCNSDLVALSPDGTLYTVSL